MGTGPGQAGREAGTVHYRSIDQPGTRPRALPPGLPPRLTLSSRFFISKYRIGIHLSLRDIGGTTPGYLTGYHSNLRRARSYHGREAHASAFNHNIILAPPLALRHHNNVLILEASVGTEARWRRAIIKSLINEKECVALWNH